MLDWTVDEAAGVIDLTVDGAIEREDYERLIPVLEAQIAKHGKLRVVETVRKIGPIDWSLWWRDL
ncbi:MAG: STAS/SEC14 domain-containing protein, partial [Proteobacteria bacterium]|nr:STAS/SEC14 domain-containing protein [Pseudomonadota bacterium]